MKSVERLPSRTAFTLVELLIVIGIIGLLISILLPALNAARKQAQLIKCQSNLRQIGVAMLYYINDNKGYFPANQGASPDEIVDGVTVTGIAHNWFGGQKGTTALYPQFGLLYRYLDTKDLVMECPSFASFKFDAASTQGRLNYYGNCDYAYNTICGPLGNGGTKMFRRKLADWHNITDKAVVWDSVRYISNAISRTPFGYPTTGLNQTTDATTGFYLPRPNANTATQDNCDPNFHGRHAGGYGNVVWMDGHVSAFKPYYFDTYPTGMGGGVNTPAGAAAAKANHIGNIDDDGNIATNEHYDIN